MTTEESTESRQKFELEALKAIYGDDLKEHRVKSAWNRWTPLNLSISLVPQQGSSGALEVHAKVDLHLICSEKYPVSAPRISLENHKGLSHNALVGLQSDLEKKADQLRGEEMIFQLCQHVQEFLHRHNKPSSKSFYDEMLKRKKEREEMDLQEKQKEKDRERQTMQEEIQKRQEILKLESRRRRDHYNSDNSGNDVDVRRQSISNASVESNEECQLPEHKQSLLLTFPSRDVQRGQCLRHLKSHTNFMAISDETGEVLLLNEWIIQTKNGTDLSNCLRQLSNIEQEVNYLTKLRHNNLAHYLGIRFDHHPDGKVVVHILKEFVNGPNCTFFISDRFNVSINFVKSVAKGVLTALDYLHRNNVVHKDIRQSCIYINDSGLVQLTNYSLHRRLTDLSARSSTSSYYSKKTDILNFGMFLLSFLQGKTKLSEEDVDIPTSIPSDLHDLLASCLIEHEKERFTATQLLNHAFFHQQVSPFSPKHKMEQIFPESISPDATQIELLSQSKSNGQSRVQNEFEFLQHLGTGAFGDVVKVKNILDGGYYAIKRIQLNPKNRQLNRKIVREVKLLSRLNHENVVRYYNSWIETTVNKSDDPSNFSRSSSVLYEKVPKIVKHEELTVDDNIEELAPPITNLSLIYDSKSQHAYNSSSDEQFSDEDDDWGAACNVDDDLSDSDGIEFERGSSQDFSAASHSSQSLKAADSADSRDTNRDTPLVKRIDFMYIQMEFCEKSTLRNAIDNNLYMDEDRVWRLFREIVEGLAHIHQQGMIHRDLKPVNIFLDSEDHVKIGDFGLATTNIKSKLNEINFDERAYVEQIKDDTLDETKTGLIGTALYVAPELSVSCKASYNQKVDIYSLGVIFFEMSYKPLNTSMERITILTGLRKKEMVLPPDFTGRQDKRSEYIVRWLLNHDVSLRPTSEELLQSEHVPPPVLEECELRELVRHTLSNPHLKGYKYLIASCFEQKFTPAQDITYDKDPTVLNVSKPGQLYGFVKEIITRIFKQHGGQQISTPLLMPKGGFYEGIDSCVNLMTHFGGIVSLPHDLRVAFARYLSWNGISVLRRYSIERVYREKKVFGFMPRELYECAFDIVTPTPGNLTSDAEILYIVYEIMKELPVIKNKHVVIRLNHTSLLRAILLHFGIKDKHREVFKVISDVREGKVPKDQLQAVFINFGLSDNYISTLTNIFSSDFEISKANTQLQMITRKKSGEASHLAKQALQEIKSIIYNAEAFGVTYEIVIAPGVVYNACQYSGMICQFVCELKKKHKHGNMEVLAAGGRYDSMITFYRKIMEDANILSRDIKQSAVGVSLSLDKLVTAVQRGSATDLPKMNFLEVAVCSVGSKPQLKEKTRILRNLWSAGLRCCLIEATNIEEIQEQCAELKVPHVVMLKESEQGVVRVRSWESDRFQEKTVKIAELVENMQRIIKSWREGCVEYVPTIGSMTKSETRTSINSYYNSDRGDHAQELNVSVVFFTVEKISANARRRYENQMRSHLELLLKKLSGDVVILGLGLESPIIRTIGSYLEFDTEQTFQKSVESVIEKHQRHKKYLVDVCDEIYEYRIKKTNPAVVLYSLSDSFYKVII